MLAFRRSNIAAFTPLDLAQRTKLPLKAYIDHVNVEIPSFNAFTMFRLSEDPLAPLELFDHLLTSSHPDLDYCSIYEHAKHGTVFFHLGDFDPPEDPWLIFISNQQRRNQRAAARACVAYPVLDRDKLWKIQHHEERRVSSKQRPVDVCFHGWYKDGFHYVERLEAVEAVRGWKDLKVDVSLSSNHRGQLGYDEWLRRAHRAKINLVLPGIGLNTWRLSELLLSGCFCLVVQPSFDLDFSPPLVNGEHVGTASVANLREVCDFYLRDLALCDAIAERGRAYAYSYAVDPGWSENIRSIVDRLTDAWTSNFGIRDLNGLRSRSETCWISG